MHFLVINIFKQKLYPLSLVLSFLLLLLIHSFLRSFEFVDNYFNIYLFVLFFITIMLSLFAVFILNTTLNGWFNKKISTAIVQSVEVANKYLL